MDPKLVFEQLSSAGVAPTGPVSPWPKARYAEVQAAFDAAKGATEVKAGVGKMAKGLVGNAVTAALHGKVSAEIREERYDTCKRCPSLIKKTKRCSECGCYMAAKTWLNGNPDQLCPLQKWAR